LESRRLLAAIVLQNRVLHVTAPGASASTITVGISADLSAVVASVAWDTGRGAHVKPHLLSESFPVTDDITRVIIVGSDQADTITIDQTYSSFPIATQIYAGGGNDTVTCGDEPDLVYGGAGNDSINGGAGNDSLYGQAGNDTLIGGPGNDYLNGRRGRDSLEGDAGNDTLHDPFGPDTILGGAGDDTFEVNNLKLDADNDYEAGVDTLHIISLPDRQPAPAGGLAGLLGSLFPITSIL
jgi:Ca2+-binding RTX toxin-like protein